MSEGINKIALYLKLKSRMDEKIQPSRGAENILPPPDFDFQNYFDRIIPEDFPEPETRDRRSYFNQWNILRYNARGKPAIIALNMLLVSYLRRETEFTEQAKHLYFRLWSEFGIELLEIIPTRDLISSLRVFSDHAEQDDVRLSAKLGFIYAHMIKIYESERKAEGSKLWRAKYKVPGGCPKIGVPGLWGALLGGDNSFEIVNVLMAEEVERVEIVGPMILTLLSRIQEGRTVFSRYDRARIGANYHMDSEREWAFGFNPQEYQAEREKSAEKKRRLFEGRVAKTA